MVNWKMKNRKKLLAVAVAALIILLALASNLVILSNVQAQSYFGVLPCSYQIFMISSTTYAQSCNGGAILDESTDAAGVIDDAIGNLTGGGKIFIHAGIYTLTTARIILGANNVASIGTQSVNNIELYGEGEASTVLVAGTNLNAIMLDLYQVKGWYIHDLAFNGTRSSQSDSGSGNPYLEGISLFNTNNTLIENVYVHDQKTYCVYVYGYNDQVAHSWIQNCNADGLLSAGGGSDIFFTDNLVDGASDVGIDISGSSGGANVTRMVVTSNVIKNINLGVSPFSLNSGTAIGMGDNGNAAQIVVADNAIGYCAGYGIAWVGKNLYNIIIEHNNIYKCKAGIYFKQTLNLQIIGNVIDDNTGSSNAYGIAILAGAFNSANILISGNIINGTSNTAIIQINGISGTNPIMGAEVTGNYVYSGPGTSNQFNGILLEYCNFTTVTGNVVLGEATNYGSGAVLDNANVTQITGNLFYNLAYGLQISQSSSHYSSENHVTSNIFKSDGTGINLQGNGNAIIGNSFLNVTTKISSSTVGPTPIINNQGYNPLGHIASPWVNSGALIASTISDSGGTGNPTNATTYTVNNSPKLITVYCATAYGAGDSALTIYVDGSEIVNLNPSVAGLQWSWTLQPGETFKVTYSPTSIKIYVSGQ
jgi:hypothetical protein